MYSYPKVEKKNNSKKRKKKKKKKPKKSINYRGLYISSLKQKKKYVMPMGTGQKK